MGGVKSFDFKELDEIVKKVMDETFGVRSEMVPTQEPETKTKDIAEYEGRMRVTGVDKFDATSFIAAVNYYATKTDMERKKPKGTMIVYVDSENATKLFKSLGFTIPEDEDDASMLDACGELCNILGGGLKNKISDHGYVNLEMSPPFKYKNSVMDGVLFSAEQEQKQEYSYYYWKRKALVVEVTMAPLVKK